MLSLTFLRDRFVTGLLAFCIGSAALAQDSPTAPTNPFFAPGFGTSPDKFFEKMFGTSTPDEEQILAKIDIPFKEEREFGQQLVQTYLADLKRQKLRVVQKGREVDYLRQLVETLRPSLTNAKRYQKITVYFVDSPLVDARSFPGGTLFFFKGLLAFVENEAALVGIVGHELSHLDRGHQLLPLKRVRLIQQQPFAGGASFDPQKFFTSGTTMMRLMGRPFRPEDEATADRDGATWAYRAGYDPREMASLFAKLHQKNQDQKIPFTDFFRTHPYNEDRYDAIMKQSAELQQKDPQEKLYRGKKNLAQRVPKSQQEFPE